MGTFYKGNSNSYHSILDNIDRVTQNYKLNKNGYFGKKGKSSKTFIRQITSDNPIEEAKKFYNIISYGGLEKTIDKSGNQIKITNMKDGTIITLRIITSPLNSPSVEINIRNSKNHDNIKFQKIHFERGDKDDNYK